MGNGHNLGNACPLQRDTRYKVQKNRAAWIVRALAVMVAGTIGSFAHAATAPLPVPPVDAALHARLPEDIQKAGAMVSVNQGSYPPYNIVGSGTTLGGASGDLAAALGHVLGIEIRHQEVGGLSGVLVGLKSGRYAFALGPIGDFPDREQSNDFIDFVQEFDVFAVPKGNPKKIGSLADVCGMRIAVIAAGAAEKVAKQYSDICVKEGRPPITVLSFGEQPTAILAVRSDRADATFSAQATLTYFVDQSDGALQLAAEGQANGFHDLYQGAVVAKGSPLGPILVDALQRLIDDGTYDAIMRKWHLQGNEVKKAEMNLPGRLAAAKAPAAK